jgi:O-antigen ligase
LVFSLATTIWLIFPIKFEVDHNQRKAAIIYNYLNSSYFFEHQAAWVMFKDYPFLGVGLGEYYHLSTRYIDWDAACAAYRFIDPTLTDFYKQNIDPHSTYLGWLAETGIIGLGSILLFFILFIKGLINSIFLSKDFNDKYVLGCFFAGILGFLWNAIYIDILTMRHFWFMLAMSAVFMNKRVMQDWN